MGSIVPVNAINETEQFGGISITRSASGHCHSPWFTYDWRQYNSGSPYAIGSHFHMIRGKAIAAFALALGIPEKEILVTSRENDESGEIQWRLGTQHPAELPKPKLPTVERMLAIEKLVGDVESAKSSQDAIDI